VKYMTMISILVFLLFNNCFSDSPKESPEMVQKNQSMKKLKKLVKKPIQLPVFNLRNNETAFEQKISALKLKTLLIVNPDGDYGSGLLIDTEGYVFCDGAIVQNFRYSAGIIFGEGQMNLISLETVKISADKKLAILKIDSQTLKVKLQSENTLKNSLNLLENNSNQSNKLIFIYPGADGTIQDQMVFIEGQVVSSCPVKSSFLKKISAVCYDLSWQPAGVYLPDEKKIVSVSEILKFYGGGL